MMGSDGYLTLVDYSLCIELKDGKKTNEICGIPEYLAPEIVKHQDYSFEVDWWALGFLVYELIVGFPPFFTHDASDNEQMYDHIKTKYLTFP